MATRHPADQVPARQIVRRVRQLNPPAASSKLKEPFCSYRFHPGFTDSDQPILEADTTHRGHAIVEQVHADLKAGPMAHLASRMFTANAA